MVIICRVTCCFQALNRVRLQQIQTWSVKEFNFFLVKHKNISRKNTNANHWEHETARTLTQTGRRGGLKYTKKRRRQSDTGVRHSGNQAVKRRSNQACWDGQVSQNWIPNPNTCFTHAEHICGAFLLKTMALIRIRAIENDLKQKKPSNKDHKPHPCCAAGAGEVKLLAPKKMGVWTVRGFSDSH